uniref:Putative zinc finger CCCH domain-containing protein 62-like n=1 Tax=Davidia involucrata TaxID=16924 RepID=A0A5B6YKX5_DAVIN
MEMVKHSIPDHLLPLNVQDLLPNRFDKMTRRGSLLGKRTVAGRIVKESYGAAKQQHTFTVEVFWSKGIRKLPPLFPLLVKGRNLYKLKTFRQVWKNEAERSKVLAEKHKRGAAARLKRAMKKTWSTNEGAKRQKHIHHERSARTKKTTERERGKRVDGRKASKRPLKSNNHRQKASPVGQVNMKRSTSSRVPNTSRMDQNLTHLSKNRDPTFQSYAHPRQNFQQSHLEFFHRGPPFVFPYHYVGSTASTMRPPHFRPYAGSGIMPASQSQGLQTAYAQPSYEFEPRNSNHFQGPMNIYRPRNAFSMRRETCGQWKNRF